jgi:hypothetical protein
MKRSPRPGWVRADHLAGPEAAEEILRLRQLNDQLTQDLSRLAVSRPLGSDALAQGEDPVELGYTVTLSERGREYPRRHHRFTGTGTWTWRELLIACGPYLLSEAKLSNIKSALNRIVRERHAYDEVVEAHPELDFGAVAIQESSLQLVIVQFTALGYISIATERDDASKEIRTAVLSPLGKHELMTATAVKRCVKAVAKSNAGEEAADE